MVGASAESVFPDETIDVAGTPIYSEHDDRATNMLALGVILAILGIAVIIGGAASTSQEEIQEAMRRQQAQYWQPQAQPYQQPSPAPVVEKREEPKRICLRCGYMLDRDSRFCKFCGNQIPP